jgi:hypothetical protein
MDVTQFWKCFVGIQTQFKQEFYHQFYDKLETFEIIKNLFEKLCPKKLMHIWNLEF